MIRLFLFLSFIFYTWLIWRLGDCDTGPKQRSSEGQEEISLISPDGSSRAYIWLPELGMLGATVSQPYQVWLQNLQGDKGETLMFSADKTYGPKLHWKSAKLLELCYDNAQIGTFRNFFTVAGGRDGQTDEIEIVLRKVAKLDDCQT